MIKWQVNHLAGTIFQAARGEEIHRIDAHCLACAKLKVVEEIGGDIDLRGWVKQGECGLEMWEKVISHRDRIHVDGTCVDIAADLFEVSRDSVTPEMFRLVKTAIRSTRHE